jgi:hypothetical protein
MTTTQSPDELQTLMAKDDLTDAEFSRLLAYVPADKMAAVFERVMQTLADVTAIDGSSVPVNSAGKLHLH